MHISIKRKYGSGVLYIYRRYEKNQLKLKKTALDLEFLRTCMANHVFPNFIRFKLFRSSLYKSHFYRRAQEDLLCIEINHKENLRKRLQ